MIVLDLDVESVGDGGDKEERGEKVVELESIPDLDKIECSTE